MKYDQKGMADRYAFFYVAAAINYLESEHD